MRSSGLYREHLIKLPAELLLQIYRVLPCFADALILSTTCHTLRFIWKEHRNVIVGAITDRFECYQYARALLATRRTDSVATEQDDLSDHSLYHLAEYSHQVEKVIRVMESDSIPRLRIEHLPTNKQSTIYGGTGGHPLKLTRTERFRVIRACYQILLLFRNRLDREVLKPQVRSLPARQLFYLAELKWWGLRNGFPTQNKWDLFQISKAITFAMRSLFWDVHHTLEPRIFEQHAQGDSDLTTIWDHSQDALKSIVCGRPLSDLRRDAKAREMTYLWDHEPGDDELIEDDESETAA